MALITENLALLLFIIILIVAAFISWYMGSYQAYDKCSFHTFFSILAGLAIFVTFMFYYNVVLLQGQQQQLAALQELARLNDSLLNSVLDNINESTNYIPNFVTSITPLTNTACCSMTGTTGSIACVIEMDPDPVTPQTCGQKMVLSYRIFALWQDVIISNRFMTLDPIPYISNFLQRANSQQLYAQWLVTKLNF